MEAQADDTDLLSKRAEVFRSKLISDFHLLESISEAGSRVDAPKYYTKDLLGNFRSEICFNIQLKLHAFAVK